MTTERSFPAPPGASAEPFHALAEPVDAPANPNHALAESARGWHRIQLAVLGFIGFCGVLWAGGDPAGPRWAQWLAAGLVVVAFGLACLAVYLVGRVAHPLSSAAGAAPAAGRLRVGVLLTYVAVAVLVVATLTAWWPGVPADAAVEVRDTTGRTWCGELVEAPTGEVRLKLASGLVTIPVDAIAEVRPVLRC